MADCDICLVAVPTCIPVKVNTPRMAYPRGVWRGLCKSCLTACHEAYKKFDTLSKLGLGKCDLCGSSLQVYAVQIPKPEVPEPVLITKKLCESCLKVCEEVYHHPPYLAAH